MSDFNTLTEVEALLALSYAPKVGPITGRKLVAHFGSARALWSVSAEEFAQITGVAPERAAEILNPALCDKARADAEWAERNALRLLTAREADYPRRLAQCDDSPLVLFVRGTCDLNARYVVGMVGTRNATTYGRKVCESLVEGLAPLGAVILSGLAYGIDISAHRAALKHGLPTVAVLGHGLDRVYPADHRKDAQDIAQQGALVSEFPHNSIPDRENFPKRNRIVAGMCDALVVVESDVSGGSMITAELANAYNRDVLAVPGHVGTRQAAGCHALIRTNRAGLIENAADLIRFMGWEQKADKAPVQRSLFVELSPEEEPLAEVLKSGTNFHVDELGVMLQWPVSRVSAHLLTLELKGVVRAMPGKQYAWIA